MLPVDIRFDESPHSHLMVEVRKRKANISYEGGCVESRKMVLMNVCAGSCGDADRDETCGHGGRRAAWKHTHCHM